MGQLTTVQQDIIRRLEDAQRGRQPFDPAPVEKVDDRHDIKYTAPLDQSTSGNRSEVDVIMGRDPAKMFGEVDMVSEREVSEVSKFLGLAGGFGRFRDIVKGGIEGLGDITAGTLGDIFEQAGIQIGEEGIGFHEIRSFGDYLDWMHDKSIFTSGITALIPEPIKDFMRREGIDQEYIRTGQAITQANDRFLSALGVRAKTPEDQTFLRALGAGGSSLITAIGLTILTKSPAAAAGFFGVIQQSGVYQQAIGAGKTPSEAMLAANAAGIVEGLLEAIGLGQLFKFIRGGGSVTTKAIQSAITEFIQEFTQEAAGAAITDVADITDIGFQAGLGRATGAGLVGFITGGGAGTAGGALQRRGVRKALGTPEGRERLATETLDAIMNEVENADDIDRETPLTERGKAGKSDRQIVEDIFEKAAQGIPMAEVFQSAEKREAAIRDLMGQMQEQRRTVTEQVAGRQRVIQQKLEQATETLDTLLEPFGPEDVLPEAIETQINRQEEIIAELQEESAGLARGDRAIQEEATRRDITTRGSVLERIRSSAEIRGFRQGKKLGRRFADQEIEEVQNIVIDFIDNLPISDRAKNKLTKKLPKINTLKKLDTALSRIASQAAGVSVRESRKKVTADINKIVKSTKVKKGAKGKLTPDIQRVFKTIGDKLIRRKMTKIIDGKKVRRSESLDDFFSRLEGERTALTKKFNEDEFPEPEDVLVQRFIDAQLRTHRKDLENPSIFEIATLRDDMESMRDTGRLAGKEVAARRTERVDTLSDQIKSKGQFVQRQGSRTTVTDAFAAPINFLVETYTTLINKIDLTNTDMDMRNADIRARRLKRNWNDRLFTSVEGLNLDDNYLASLRKKENIFKVEDPKHPNQFRRYNKGEALYLWQILQNGRIREQFLDPDGVMGWTQDDINRLESSLEARDLQLARAMFLLYDDIYGVYNEGFKQKYHRDLPREEFYTPVHRVNSKGFELNAPSESTFLGDTGSMRPASSRERVKASNVEFKAINVIDDYTNYVSQVSHFVAYSEQMDIIQSALKREDVKQHLRGVLGDKGFENLNSHLEFITRKGRTTDEVQRIAENLRQNFFKVALGFKAKIGLAQLATTFSFKSQVPAGAWIKYESEFMANPVKAIRIMNQNETIRNRGKNFDPEIAQLGTLGPITKFATMPIRIGDISAIYMGGWAMFRHLTVDKGMSSEQALERVAEFAETSQQSVMPSNMSLAQKSDNAFHRALVMFRSSPIAMLNVSLQAIDTYKNGPRTLKNWNKMMQTLALQNIVVPIVFNTLAQGQRATLFVGALVGVPVLGEGLTTLITILFNTFGDEEKERVFAPTLGVSAFEFSEEFIKDLEKASRKIMAGEGEFEDWITVVGDMLEAFKGLPVDNAFSVLKGFGDLAGGDIDKGVLEIMGYPKSTVKKITGGSKGGSLAGRI